MGLIEQSMIPLNKAIKAMKLDPSAAAASTAPSWDRPRAACGIIRLSIWMK